MGTLFSLLLKILMFLPLLLCRELRNTLVFRNGAVRIDIGAKSALRFRPGSKLRKGLEQLSKDADVRVLLINIRSVDMGWAELQQLRSLLQKNREAGKILFAQLHTMDKRALFGVDCRHCLVVAYSRDFVDSKRYAKTFSWERCSRDWD